MPDRVPFDDLYARLGVARDADRAHIDRAWRALLKRHHPDVAGADSLEAAKRINVAHEWLVDPERRARYDAAVARRMRPAPPGRSGAAHPAPRSPRPPLHRRAHAPDEHDPRDGLDERFGFAAAEVRRLLRRATSLTADEIDRLSVSPPGLEAAALRPFLPEEHWARVESLDGLLAVRLPRPLLDDPVAGAAIREFGHALVLEPFVAHHFADPDAALAPLRRGWEAAVGKPRYGPNDQEVRGLVARIQRATGAQLATLADDWDRVGGSAQPWPDDAWEFDFAALEVSASLARRDAQAAVDTDGFDDVERRRVRAAVARTAHVLALRPIFRPGAYSQLQRAWTSLAGSEGGVGGEREGQPRPRVRRA